MAMRLASSVKSTGVAEAEAFRNTRTSSQLIRNAALRRSRPFRVASSSSFRADELLDFSGSAPRETASIAHMQRSCLVEHAHDGIRLSQNFADCYRELSRSVSGMLHCIVRDRLGRLRPMAAPVSRTSITLLSMRLRKLHRIPAGMRGCDTLRQRWLAGTRFCDSLWLECFDSDRGSCTSGRFLSEQAGILRIPI
jgi:hypothetical protein